MVERIEADVLVAGGGMGGLMAATRAHLAGARVVFLTGLPGASVRMAGFATALLDAAEDRPERLFNDMFIAGGFLSDPRVLAAVVARIGPETRFLEELGTPFDRKEGRLARRQAAGVTWPRAVFTSGMVGLDAGKLLIERLRQAGAPPVWVLDRGMLMDLDVRDGVIQGGLVYVRSTKDWAHVVAPAVVLATGGAGRLYRRTTNFPGTNGTGYALALEAGAALVDMEFVSFEPTVAMAPEKIAEMELPTMAFSEGARLRNGNGDEFLPTMPPPSKDVMSRAIVREVQEGRGSPSGGAYFDLSGMTEEAALHYSQVRRVLRALDATPAEARIEVFPTQHYLMGGVQVDGRAATRVPGLYAVGEVAGGAHGAHRLATCGGTEVIAMGAIAGEAAAAYAEGAKAAATPGLDAARPELLEPEAEDPAARHLDTIRGALEEGCGVLRHAERLAPTLAILDSIRAEQQRAGGLKNWVGRATLVATALARSASLRTESRGDHFRTDYPYRDDRRWLGNIVTELAPGGGDIAASYRQAGIGARGAAPLP
jgi:succinate dehydrogenase/fumarate reductase flavoprotein subunit